MYVSLKNKKVEIDRQTFVQLFDNSIYYDHKDYLEALEKNSIGMQKLVTLAREASINYALFFVDNRTATGMLDKENKKIFQGFGGNFTLSIRGKAVNLNSVRMVIKDIKIKQSFITKYLQAPKNPHLRYLAHSPKPVTEQAEYILKALDINLSIMRAQKNKPAAMMYLVDQLDKQNVLVALEATTNMPQNMNHAQGVSGVYIKDSRYPYLFIANEGQVDFESGAGRKIFTIMYLAVCMFKGRSKVVALQEKIQEGSGNGVYEIVEHMLMPSIDIPSQSVYSIKDLDALSEELKVTSRAVLLRLKHLGYIQDENYWQLMNLLKNRFERYKNQQKKLRQEGKTRYAPNVAANIVAYHGKAFVRILKNLHASGKVTQRQINLHLAYGRQEVNTSDVFKKV